MARIAVGGFQHETNVFAPHQADYAGFQRRGDWPPLCRGETMLQEVSAVHLPVSGAIERLKQLGHEVVPLLWCSATPSAEVTSDAFERISTMILDDLGKASAIDGVLLDLHGAMVCESHPDGDGELLRRVRVTVGEHIPMAVCLDLHANISDQMIAQASVLEAYRTYPHVDMGLTGGRAADHLNRLLQQGLARFPANACRRPDFLIPPHWASTLMDPAHSIYDLLADLADGDIEGISLACGFPYSDVYEAGPCIVTYGFEQPAVDRVADQLLDEVQRSEHSFNGRLYDVDDAVNEAMRRSATARGPIVLADTQDNPGGGGPGDTTAILRSLVQHKAPGAVVGMIIDAEVVAQAHAAGQGDLLKLQLGEKSGLPGHEPFAAEFMVVRVADGRFRATGPMLDGAQMDIGATALLQTGGVQIVVGSKAMQTLDQSMFSHLGIQPSQQKIIALKSSVHFRNDFQAIAEAIFLVAAPGPVLADLAALPFRNLRSGIRISQ